MEALDTPELNNGAAESSNDGNVKMTELELLKELKALRNENAKLKSRANRTTSDENVRAGSLMVAPENVVDIRPASIIIDSVDEGARAKPQLQRDDQNQQATTVRPDVSSSPASGMSLSALGIPECLPTDGDSEIDRKSYEHWKKIFEASMDLMRSVDENTRFSIFKIKAGVKLLEVYDSTATTSGMPDEKDEPYSNAIARLNEYYGSRTYMLTQRSKLINMVQRKDEDSVQFVRRVGAATKLCGYHEDEEMEAIVRTITKGTLDNRVRKLAHRNWTRQGSLKELIDAVRDSEIERYNEEEFVRSQQPKSESVPRPAVLAAVERYPNQRGFRPEGYNGGKLSWSQDGRHGGPIRVRRGNSYRSFGSHSGSASDADRCWRCSSVYHSAAKCPMTRFVTSAR
ncbi:uncharacterized protein LOC115262083 [Aedes albopictus]|uniref:Uncharacterized protein n=1 Tax=Aedes albopictus TaxID=7160 RepID=A0ABM1ZUK5_AEDAL